MKSGLIIVLFLLSFDLAHADHRKGIDGGIPINANDDLLYMFESDEVYSPVLSNDYGLEGSQITLSIVKAPQNGVYEIKDDLKIYYKPNRSYIGKDELTYRVCSSNGECDEATLYIQVSDFDFKPEAVNDTILMEKGMRETLDVLLNDAGMYDLPLQMTISQELHHGYTQVNEDYTVTVTLDTHYIGLDSLEYRVCDLEGDCTSAWVYFTITNSSELNVFIPGGISPNGDGMNDLFVVPEFDYYRQFRNIRLSILNRWGELVYETPTYQNDWGGTANRGTYSGSLLPAGVYYYQFRLEGNSTPLTGCVYINR